MQGTVAQFPSPARRRPKVNCPHPPDKLPDGSRPTRRYVGAGRCGGDAASDCPLSLPEPVTHWVVSAHASQNGRPGLH